MKTKEFKHSEASIFRLLKTLRYPEESVALLPQVANSTGLKASRTADAIAMQLYPSRGLTIEGFEIKVSRSDWLSELSKPEKADVIYSYCDRWWVVAPAGVVNLTKDDFPKTWGLLEVVQIKSEGTDETPKFKIVEEVKAPHNLEPQSPDRGFIAAVLRSLQKNGVGAEELRLRVQEARESEHKAAKQLYATKEGRNADELARLRKQVEDFQVHTGLRIEGPLLGKDEYLKDIGDKVRLLRNTKGSLEKLKVDLCSMQRVADYISKTTASMLSEAATLSPTEELTNG